MDPAVAIAPSRIEKKVDSLEDENKGLRANNAELRADYKELRAENEELKVKVVALTLDHATAKDYARRWRGLLL